MGLAGAGSGALPPPLICREIGALMLLRSKEGPANLVLADCGEKRHSKSAHTCLLLLSMIPLRSICFARKTGKHEKKKMNGGCKWDWEGGS
eukprot:2072156-Rhodomonas_salina.1